MKTLLKNGHIFTEKGFEKRDVFVVDDRLSFSDFSTYDESIDCDSFLLIPGFTDVHVHFVFGRFRIPFSGLAGK